MDQKPFKYQRVVGDLYFQEWLRKTSISYWYGYALTCHFPYFLFRFLQKNKFYHSFTIPLIPFANSYNLNHFPIDLCITSVHSLATIFAVNNKRHK